MRLTIFTLLAITAAAGASAALSQLEFELGLISVIAIATASIFIVPKSAWRYCFYYAIGGIAIGIALMLIHTYFTLGHISGSYAATDFVFEWRPWILFEGSWVGGTTGFLLFQAQQQFDLEPKTTNSHAEKQS